jgi:hypothetical protein
MLTFSRTRKTPMSVVRKFCVVALIGGWMVSARTLACPLPATPQQATPSPAADPDKQTSAPAKPHQPRPNPDAAGKYHIGDGVTAPILVHAEEPEAPKKICGKLISPQAVSWTSPSTPTEFQRTCKSYDRPQTPTTKKCTMSQSICKLFALKPCRSIGSDQAVFKANSYQLT